MIDAYPTIQRCEAPGGSEHRDARRSARTPGFLQENFRRDMEREARADVQARRGYVGRGRGAYESNRCGRAANGFLGVGGGKPNVVCQIFGGGVAR